MTVLSFVSQLTTLTVIGGSLYGILKYVSKSFNTIFPSHKSYLTLTDQDDII